MRNGSGTSLTDPTGTAAIGRNKRGNFGLYVGVDQLAFREPGTKAQGLGVFGRIQGAPGDRNLVNFYFDAGVTYKGAIPGRNSDTLGLAFALARISDTASQYDAVTARATGGAYPIRRPESVLELTYQAQIAPWWQLQPTVQYAFNLNGGVPNPQQPSKRLPDATVLGLRTVITF